MDTGPKLELRVVGPSKQDTTNNKEQQSEAKASRVPNPDQQTRSTWSLGAVAGDMSYLCCGSSFMRCSWCCFLSVAIVIVSIVLLATSIHRVNSTEVALAYDDVEKKLDTTLLHEGLHTIMPFGTLIKWPTVYQTLNFEDDSIVECNTKDAVVMACAVTFQYVVEVNNVYNLTMQYRNFANFNQIVVWRARSAIRHACARFTAREFQTKRAQVPAEMRREVERYLRAISARVIEVQLLNTDRPDRYEGAVESKEAAVADIELASNERQQALTLAQTHLLLAYQNANKTLNTARKNSDVLISRSVAEEEAIQHRYATLGRVYKEVMETQDLSVEGVLAYLSTRMLAASPDALHVKLDSPARASWLSEL